MLDCPQIPYSSLISACICASAGRSAGAAGKILDILKTHTPYLVGRSGDDICLGEQLLLVLCFIFPLEADLVRLRLGGLS